jgi:hypothetical protein
MINTNDGPLPRTRYATVPNLVGTVRTGTETIEAGAAADVVEDEPHPPSAADIAIAVSPSAIRHRPGRRAGLRAPDTAPQHDVARASG